MKQYAIAFAVGAGVVYLAGKGSASVAPSLPASVQPYTPLLIGGVALIVAHKLLGSAA